MSSVQTGKPAPAITLLNHVDRKPTTLNSLKGKKVVLAFFPGAFTGVCTKEACALQDSLAAFNAVNAAVLGVSVDSPFAQKGFADANKITFPFLSDFNREATRAYGIELPSFAGMTGYTAAKRSVFVLDRDGIVRYTWVSDNPGVEPDYAAIKSALAAIP